MIGCTYSINGRRTCIFDVEAIKTVQYAPRSHPFVERLIGTIRRERLDRTLFWTATDLELKLLDFQRYDNVIALMRG
jgi:putative transposase